MASATSWHSTPQKQKMIKREKLPTVIATQAMAVLSEKRGSLVGRGLAAVENNKQLALTKSGISLRIWGAENLGDPLDQLLLADDYRNGNGLDQDDKKSIYWYRKAAEQGNKHGQACLGIGYRDGRGIEQNDEQAVFWLRKAAEQGSEYGQVSLGCMYMNGQEAVRNEEKAVYWFRQAAEQGDEEGQSNLGVMYEYGLGVGQDDEQAVYWYRKAAGQGNHQAQEALRKLGIDLKK